MGAAYLWPSDDGLDALLGRAVDTRLLQQYQFLVRVKHQECRSIGPNQFLCARQDIVPRRRWVANMGLEWAVRLVREPRRLWRRYLLGLPVFGFYILSTFLTGRKSAV